MHCNIRQEENDTHLASSRSSSNDKTALASTTAPDIRRCDEVLASFEQEAEDHDEALAELPAGKLLGEVPHDQAAAACFALHVDDRA